MHLFSCIKQEQYDFFGIMSMWAKTTELKWVLFQEFKILILRLRNMFIPHIGELNHHLNTAFIHLQLGLIDTPFKFLMMNTTIQTLPPMSER